MTAIYVIVGVALLIFVAYMILRESSSIFGNRSKPNTATGYKPSVKPMMSNQQRDFQVAFKGEGIRTTEPVYLATGIYRIQHQFPPDTIFKVELVSADGSSTKTILHKSGFGTTTFNVQMSKYYVLQIEPDGNVGNWAIVLKGY